MASERAKQAMAKVRAECESGARLCPEKIGAATQAMRQTLRDADLAATELAYHLAEVTDHEDRQVAIREMENRVLGLKREAELARKKVAAVDKAAGELKRSWPDIAERLGIEE